MPYLDLEVLSNFVCAFQEDRPSRNPYEIHQDWFDECSLEIMAVKAIDPGIRDMISGVGKGDSREQPNTFRQVDTLQSPENQDKSV